MSEWVKVHLAKVTKIEYGDNLPSIHLKAQGYPVFGANGYIGYNDKYNTEIDSVLISCRGEYSGTINYVKAHTFITNNSIILRIKDNDLTTRFLYYLLHTLSHGSIVSGSAQPQVTIDDLNRVVIYYPKNTSEQTKIATVLSTVDEVIEKTEAAIEKYKAIKAGMMQDLFTRGIDVKTGKLRHSFQEAPALYKETELGWIPKEWEVCTIKEACLEFVNGGTPSTKNTANWVGTIPWITGADFLGTFEVGHIRRYINEEALRNSSSHLIRKGNILLVSRTGVGKLAIAPYDVAISQDITGIILDPSTYCVEFFYYYLQLLVEDFKKINQGTSINGIIRSDLEATLIAEPHIDEQKQIAAVLKALDETLMKEQSNLSKYYDLKIGLMADLLTGKVKVSEEIN
ncbi:MAG: restriction endonuclease subunit S [Candidatus Cloacimonetes bacterium]|nr:restriction endonuclease subunit S [Candidatus Cloacimonadota bacterium]